MLSQFNEPNQCWSATSFFFRKHHLSTFLSHFSSISDFTPVSRHRPFLVTSIFLLTPALSLSMKEKTRTRNSQPTHFYRNFFFAQKGNGTSLWPTKNYNNFDFVFIKRSFQNCLWWSHRINSSSLSPFSLLWSLIIAKFLIRFVNLQLPSPTFTNTESLSDWWRLSGILSLYSFRIYLGKGCSETLKVNRKCQRFFWHSIFNMINDSYQETF